MEIIFVPKSKSHLDYFKKTNNQIVLKKIKQILVSIQETPYEGIGKTRAIKT